jgi:hypothetical protein
VFTEVSVLLMKTSKAASADTRSKVKIAKIKATPRSCPFFQPSVSFRISFLHKTLVLQAGQQP